MIQNAAEFEVPTRLAAMYESWTHVMRSLAVFEAVVFWGIQSLLHCLIVAHFCFVSAGFAHVSCLLHNLPALCQPILAST